MYGIQNGEDLDERRGRHDQKSGWFLVIPELPGIIFILLFTMHYRKCLFICPSPPLGGRGG